MIEVKNLTKKFEDFTALNNVTCNIPNSSIYGMIGSNGAGKSTFLRILTGIYKADAGEVLIDGLPVYENPKAKEKFVYVPDEPYFLPSANLEEMAIFYSAAYASFDNELLHNLAYKLKLNTLTNLSNFSKGMRRQAAIILAISAKPEYLFFDETFDGLDPIVRTVIKGMIYSETAERNATAIITSHSLRELEDTCDQLALLHNGGLVFEREITDLKTSLFKVQIALPYEFDQSTFKDIETMNYSKKGSVANLIVKGDKQKTVEHLKTLQPVLLDVLPLSLEEVFTYEMNAIGYDFGNM